VRQEFDLAIDRAALNEVVFNQVLVACADPEQTLATLRRLQDSGECWCGGSSWQGQTVIRLSICSRATTPEDIDRTVAAFSKARGWHFPVAIGPEPC